MRTAIVLVTVAALLTAGVVPAFASGLGGPDDASSAVGAADRHSVSSSTEPPTRAETTATPTSTSTSTSTPTPAQNGSNTTDAAGPPPEAKIAAGLLDGGDGRGGSDGRATDGLTTAGVEMVDVVVEAAPGAADAVARRVRGNAGTVSLRHGRFVQGSLPRTALTAVADTPAVERIRRPNRPVAQAIDRGSVESEGLSNMNVSPAYGAGQYGDNVTVAVVDLQFDATNPEISDHVVDVYDPSGSFSNESGGHGTAVSELVVDTAPNASLVLIDINSELGLYNAMDYIRENTSADVAVMSLSWYNVGPMDGSGHFNDQFRQSAANGTLWSVSAGNTANGNHWNGTWQDGDNDGWLNFTSNRETITVDSDGSGSVWLQWDDWPKSDQDLDLYVYDSDGNQLAVNDAQTDANPKEPTEYFGGFLSGTYYIKIKRGNGGSEPLNITLFSGDSQTLTPSVSAGSVTNPTTDAVLTVGATYYGDNSVESFSSRGPTIDGRIKPDVVAPDGVSTDVYNPFYGTSASAPHAGGVVALALDKNESLTPADAISLLESTANESAVDGTEPNNDVGYGLVDAGVAVSSTDYSDTTRPVLTGATAVDGTDSDGIVGGGDTVRVNVTAADDGSGLENVTANASDFGAGEVSLADQDRDGIYNATFVVNASSAAPNGTYSISIEAYDRAGNNNTTQTDTLDLAIADREEPSITDAHAVDGDGDGNVTALEEITLNATATDADSGIDAVTADASAFGAGTVALTDPDGDDVYNATIAVDADQAAPNGSYAVSVTAVDVAGNENSTATNALQLNVSDRAAPNITDFGVQVTDTRTLYTSFDSNETLSTVNLTITDLDSNARVRTLSLSDFDTPGGGTYVNQTVLPDAGRYRLALATAADAAGNDGSGDANATVKLVTRDVVVTHLDGPAPDMANVTANVYLTQGSGGLLQVQLRDAADSDLANRTDLSDLGVEPTTTLAVNVTVRNWTPRLLLGAGRNATWNVTAVDADTTTINVTADPADVQYNETQLDGTTKPWSETDTADFGSPATIDLAVSDLSGFDRARRNRFDGTMLLTDAQAFGTPAYNTTTDALSLYVAAPHLNASGGQNRGFFDAFLPTAVLNDWGVSDPASINVSALGTSASPAESTITSEGIRLEIPIHYSAGDVELAPDSTPPTIASPSITDATDGDGTVEDGDRVRVSATVTDATSGVDSVSADAASFGAGTVSLSDSDGDDTYTGTFTVDGGGIGADGSYSVSVSATDVAGNAGSKSTNALQFDGGSDGGGSGGGGGGGGGGGAPLPPPQTATPTPKPTPTPTPTPTPDPRVRVDRTAGGVSVTVERAAAGQTVSAEFGDAATSAVAGVTGLRLRPSADATNFSVSVTPPTPTTADAPALDGGTAVGYFRADAVGLPDDRIAGASLRFTVSESSLPPGATPERVRLYRYHDGAWQRLDTTHLGDGVYEATTPGFSVFAIGVDDPSADGGVVGSTSGTTAADSAASDGSDGDSIAGAATPSSSRTEATVSTPGTSGGSTPGFGIVVAVAAVLLAAATVTRRR